MEVTSSEIFEIMKNVQIAGDLTKIDDNSILSENGVDSLDMANILLLLEERYSIKIPDEDIIKLGSINAIIEYLSNK